jgi:hypothetical protein
VPKQYNGGAKWVSPEVQKMRMTSAKNDDDVSKK